MKTCEQVAAEVFARRDAYLAERAARRRAAKKYTTAALLVFAAAFAAAGLYRSGWLGAVPPVSLQSDAPAVDRSSALPEPSGDLTVTRNAAADAEPGPSSMPPQAADGATAGASIDLSPGGRYEMRLPSQSGPASAAEENRTTEEPAGRAAERTTEAETAVSREQASSSAAQTARRPERRTEPTADRRTPETEQPASPTPTTAGEDAVKPSPPKEPDATRREPEATPPTSRSSTVPDDAVTLPAPTKETATRREPETEPPTRQPPPTTDSHAAASSPDAEPSTDEPNAGTPLPPGGQSAASEEDPRTLYVLYNGAVYAAENAAPTSVPAGARTLEQKNAVVEGNVIADETLVKRYNGNLLNSPAGDPPGTDPTEELTGPDAWENASVENTQITLLSLPSQYAGLQLGVTVEGSEGVFVLEYVGRVEELS